MTIETIEHKSYTIKIEQDDQPEGPREWDNLGTMYCVHRRYNLGDEHDMTASELLAFIADFDGVVLPLYLYDHSGITMNTTGFSCPWDSGQVGFIAVSREKILEEYSWKKLSHKRRDRIRGYLKNEVETYDQFLRGEVYGYITEDADENHIDSCWGFYDKDHMIQEAKDNIDYHIENNVGACI
jgi:hypothetical protein